MVEALEDRQLLSSSGVISSITAPNGLTYAYAIGSNGAIYYSMNGPWMHLGDNTGGGTFRQVSAGLWGSVPVCYAIENGGSLWVFSHTFQSGGSNMGVYYGGVCLQISATRNGECYAIGSDHNIWLNDVFGSWNYINSPSDGAVQISAGVDQWGQDKVYSVDTYGFILEDNHDGSAQWLRDSHGHYLQANQVSAGIGNNSTGVDLYYLDTKNQLHSFEGFTDTMLGPGGTQISAGLRRDGTGECYVLGFDNHLYTVTTPWNWTYDGGWMTQISGAQNDMVFVVGGSNQIFAFDPEYQWAYEWASGGGWNSGNWHYWGGISANPFA
jgi:hypothetical protein